VRTEAERIYDGLRERGIAAVLDDRDERAGVKFNDADLIGYPVQVTVGKRGLRDSTVDLKLRSTGERSSSPLAEAVAAASALLDAAP
jgi:prolyl-tRNA synthetase